MSKRVSNPKIGSIVKHLGRGIESNSDYPCDVYIENGQYEVAQPFGAPRISNFWYWRKVLQDGTLGEIECGYGDFCESENEYEIKVTTIIKKKQ